MTIQPAQPVQVLLQRLLMLRNMISIVQGLLLIFRRILCPLKLLQQILLAPSPLVARDPRLMVLSSLIQFLKRWVLYLNHSRGSISLVVKQLPSLV
ncbi:hypothetical protein NC652_008273 [Populus alba x Populus x berolinensis]|nr:hypothetical protein NC652_008273 [Populus alba x Populus x berolinensis]